MTTKKKKKKSILQSTFYRVYFALVVLALVCIALGTAWLRGVLRDYESAQPVHVAKDVARLFETSDYGAIYGMDTSAAAIAEGDESIYLQSMRELTAGRDVEWTESFSADPDERNYAVTLDGERFASFTLVPSGRRSARGELPVPPDRARGVRDRGGRRTARRGERRRHPEGVFRRRLPARGRDEPGDHRIPV